MKRLANIANPFIRCIEFSNMIDSSSSELRSMKALLYRTDPGVFKVVGERETDTRLDAAAEHLKELIAAVKEGFKDNGSKMDRVDSSLKDISGKQDELINAVKEGFSGINLKVESADSSLKEISGKQDELIDAVDEARDDIVSEVKGLRSDLKGRMEERLQRIESDVVEIKARMKS